MKAILVDDEPHAIELFRRVLELFEHDIEVVAEASNLNQAKEQIDKFNPDVVFMDIDMPQHSGLEITKFYDETRSFELVFVTAHSQYAIEAIKIATFDYLLKPIDPRELEGCYLRLQQKTDLKSRPVPEQINPDIVEVVSHNGSHYINTNDILYLEASGVYCIIHRVEGQPVIVSKPLGEFIKALPPYFMRIHRSYAVNLQKVEKKLNTDSGELELINGSRIPISKQHKAEFNQKILRL